MSPPKALPLIVAIDDDSITRQLLERSLSAMGFRCLTASTGAGGIALIAKEHPDLVLLDLLLEEDDGFRICKEIRRTWSPQELPVVVITGLEDFLSIERAYEVGANDYMTKPLHWGHLPYHLRNILRANQAFKDLSRNAQTLRSLIAAHPDFIFFITIEEGEILVQRASLAQGDAPLTSIGKLRELLPEGLVDKVVERFREALAEPGQVFSLEAPYAWEGELMYWEARFIATTDNQVLVMTRDITERRGYERRIQHMAFHDTLTGLWNRNALSSALSNVLQDLERSVSSAKPKTAALLYLDLDKFKRINDTLGHAIGDDLLKVVAERIGGALRPTDLVTRPESEADDPLARVGGDEFCVILTSIENPMDAGRVAGRIVEIVGTPIELEGHELVVTPSIGIALMPQDGRDPDTLLKHADRAMYVAKEGGRNRFQFFDPSMNSHLLERLALEAGMRRALAQECFRVHFQPKVDARNGTLLGMEALVRWDDPEIGVVSPAKFIPVAEETGLILELGEFVLLYALNFNKTLQEEGLPPIRVAVNLSSVQMKDHSILSRVERCLATSGLNPRYLELEVTESILLEGSGRALSILNDLKGLGITLALDDFGTGYSFLGYLHRYPFNVLKIDQSFVRTLVDDPQSRSLASAIIAMGHSLGLEMIAEGVEKPEQAEFLMKEGCHAAQGYLYGRPMDPESFRAFYREKLKADHYDI